MTSLLTDRWCSDCGRDHDYEWQCESAGAGLLLGERVIQ